MRNNLSTFYSHVVDKFFHIANKKQSDKIKDHKKYPHYSHLVDIFVHNYV